ncbi:hypothetical protein DXN05_19985 [Deminuibacter soli]|uniref:Outer membrane lipoprotein carrier protein LolA n=2 Tax=Deminuibacter soli TaxID=2291815 RepID=A0A3E1NF03_9BACT|nr:hypothetical protein DXN05_19985 [Deminuibacter soli]
MLCLLCCIGFTATAAQAQDVSALVAKVRAKIDQVNDYTAEGRLKTNIAFLKVPVSRIKTYFKKPDKFRLRKEGGISVLPKGGFSVNMQSLILFNDAMAIAAGDGVVDGVKTKIVKLLPNNENSDVILSTLYIDETNLLVKKAVTTTRENGTYDITLTYGQYAAYALPDKVIFAFNTKDYKLPKGVTLEFEDAEKPADASQLKNKKGKVEIVYSSYVINKGIDDAVFK